MDNPETDEKGPNERVLAAVCRSAGARLEISPAKTASFAGAPPEDGVKASAKGETAAGARWSVSSLAKPTRDEACASVLKMMLFPEVASYAGLPPASSADELLLKAEVMSPS